MASQRHKQDPAQLSLSMITIVLSVLQMRVECLDMEPAQKLMQPLGPGLTSPLYVTTFPYTLCQRSVNSPYKLEFTSSSSNNNGTSRHCFQLALNPAFQPSTSTTSDTCQMMHDLRGIEFNIWGKCRRMVRGVSFNNTHVHTIVSCFSKQRGCVLKVTRGLGQVLTRYQDLQRSKTAAVCFTLMRTCADGLHKLCKAPAATASSTVGAHAPIHAGNATCEIAFFDPDRQCCGA